MTEDNKRQELIRKVLDANTQIELANTKINQGIQLRAVALCRCSTEEESQRDALVQQVKEAKDCIAENGWQLIDMYVEAKSGTTTKGREEYNRLFQDLATDKFDIVVIKSQDRLMRNTRDWYIFIDRLVKNGKRLYFYLERKFYSSDDALITGIKAILAEEYSRELSKKINNMHKHRQKAGKSFMLTNSLYGYKKEKGKPIEIDEYEAEMIKKIFMLSAEGYGGVTIGKILYDQGYHNRKGGMISSGVIRDIIHNPIFTGDIVQNKGHFDFESKHVIANPKEDWIIHEDVVPAIISKELFKKANEQMDLRRPRNREVHLKVSVSKYALSGKVLCGLCGKTYHRESRLVKNGRVIEWRCSTYVKEGRNSESLKRKWANKIDVSNSNLGCDNININEDRLFKQLEQFALKHYADVSKEEIMQVLMNAMKQVLEGNKVESKINSLQSKIKKWENQKSMLLDKLLDGVITDSDYKSKSSTLDKQIVDADNEIDSLNHTIEQNDFVKKRIRILQEKMENIVIDKAKVASVIEHIDNIVIFPDYLELHINTLKSLGLDQSMFPGATNSIIKIPNECASSRKDIFQKEEKIILAAMKANPKTTVKEIAKQNGWPLSRANNRVSRLKAKGVIKYSALNGRGHWIILDDNLDT